MLKEGLNNFIEDIKTKIYGDLYNNIDKKLGFYHANLIIKKIYLEEIDPSFFEQESLKIMKDDCKREKDPPIVIYSIKEELSKEDKSIKPKSDKSGEINEEKKNDNELTNRNISNFREPIPQESNPNKTIKLGDNPKRYPKIKGFPFCSLL